MQLINNIFIPAKKKEAAFVSNNCSEAAEGFTLKKIAIISVIFKNICRISSVVCVNHVEFEFHFPRFMFKNTSNCVDLI